MSWKTWLDVLQNRPQDDDCIEFIMDLTGYPPVMYCLFIGMIVLFLAWSGALEWSYRKHRRNLNL